jgi:hypothetical protein
MWEVNEKSKENKWVMKYLHDTNLPFSTMYVS